MYTSEIYFVKKDVGKDDWSNLIKRISSIVGYLRKWKIIIKNDNRNIHFYIISNVSLPSIICGVDNFMLGVCSSVTVRKNVLIIPGLEFRCFIDIINNYDIKDRGYVDSVEIEFMMFKKDVIRSNVTLNIFKNNGYISKHLLFAVPEEILTNNFNINKTFICKGVPKYFDITKIMKRLNSDRSNTLFKVDTFPFLQGKFYLKYNSYDFASHSLILGSSGTGKSKFIASLIKSIVGRDNYKIVVIDPHSSLENDIGGLGKVIDFLSLRDSINLFSSNKDVISSTEIMMSNLMNLFDSDKNAKMERVLRYSINLLLSLGIFNFLNLKRLLNDIEYRNSLLKNRDDINRCVIEFFLTDFNELRSKSYGEAIAPIITFLDELILLPAFNSDNIKNNLEDGLDDNDLLLFSLDRTRLGDKVTKTISNLITGELLNIIESKRSREHIIFIVDEISLLENPLFSKMLSEARKYNLSLVLCGQYLNQVSDELKSSIFANVINYYIFRVSKKDAKLLCDNFNMKLYPNNDIEEQRKYLSELQDRECVLRLRFNGILLPAFKGITNDFVGVPRVYKDSDDEIVVKKINNISFKIDSNISVNDVLMSTKRGE